MDTLAEMILERDKERGRRRSLLHYEKRERRSRSPKSSSPFGEGTSLGCCCAAPPRRSAKDYGFVVTPCISRKSVPSNVSIISRCLSKSDSLVSIIIVTVGANDYFKSCLDSISQQTYPELEVIVIDNSLSKNVSDWLLKYPEIKLYSQEKKLSYCVSLNKGIEVSSGDFVLCLNDDVLLDKNFIKEALRGFSVGETSMPRFTSGIPMKMKIPLSSPFCKPEGSGLAFNIAKATKGEIGGFEKGFSGEKIGMVSGKILRFDKRTIDSAGLFLSPWRTPKERGYGIRDSGKFEREEYIFGVNGAVAFYRKKMLDEIKIGLEYFDSDFNFFYEDLDIAWRARNLGWRCYYIPKAIAYHLRGGSLRRSKGIGNKYARHYLSDDLHFDLVKNRYLCIVKNEKFIDFLLHLPFIVLYDLIVLTYLIIFKPSLIKKIFLAPIPLKSAFKKRKLLTAKKL